LRREKDVRKDEEEIENSGESRNSRGGLAGQPVLKRKKPNDGREKVSWCRGMVVDGEGIGGVS